jgi:hypothetical protein
VRSFRLTIGVVCIATAFGTAARAHATAMPVRPFAVGPTVFSTDTRSMLVGDGTRYLAWLRADGALERWDTKTGGRLVRSAGDLGTDRGCTPVDLRHGIILDSCGAEPRLIRARDLSLVPTAVPGTAVNTYGWERVGSQWLAGGQYTCDHADPEFGCPVSYLNWHTGEVRFVTEGRSSRDLDAAGLPPIGPCGRLTEFWCVPDGSSVLRMSFTKGLSLARPGRSARPIRLPGFYRSTFAGGAVATIGRHFAFLLNTRTFRSVKFALPDLGPGHDWHTIATTRQRILISNMANGLSTPYDVRYYSARVPSALWR